jgi:hypothetical protein
MCFLELTRASWHLRCVSQQVTLRLMLCQWVNHLTVQYLPVYYPSKVRGPRVTCPAHAAQGGVGRLGRGHASGLPTVLPDWAAAHGGRRSKTTPCCTRATCAPPWRTRGISR